eukprot:240724-Chlamydomonas_euryale.AAC.1
MQTLDVSYRPASIRNTRCPSVPPPTPSGLHGTACDTECLAALARYRVTEVPQSPSKSLML